MQARCVLLFVTFVSCVQTAERTELAFGTEAIIGLLFRSASASVPWTLNKPREWLSEWVMSIRDFSPRARGWGWCPNFEYTHSTEKACDTTLNCEKYRTIIQYCNNTHQGAHVPANKRALACRTSVTLVTLSLLVHCAVWFRSSKNKVTPHNLKRLLCNLAWLYGLMLWEEWLKF